MTTAGLEALDKTVQTTNVWLKEIGEDIGPDRERCYHALRAVLAALRDRLTVDEAAHLAAQLPTLVRGLYYDGYVPAGKPERAALMSGGHISREALLSDKPDGWERSNTAALELSAVGCVYWHRT